MALNSMTTLDQIQGIYDGRIDAGFLYNPPLNDPLLTVLPITRHAVLLAVQTGSPFAARESVDAQELNGMPLISFFRRQSPIYYDELHRGLFKAGVTVRIVHEGDNEAEMLALVTTGLGVALVNECQRWRKPQGIAFVPVTGLDVGLNLAFVYRSNHAVPALRQFLALLEKRQAAASA
jgi:DNA-binding transcriptional LysR family regulator